MLQELGLYSLTDILRGGVRIEKNPLLCFVDTVNWDLIAKAGHSSISVCNQDRFESLTLSLVISPHRLLY
jgi:hypothetical protein